MRKILAPIALPLLLLGCPEKDKAGSSSASPSASPAGPATSAAAPKASAPTETAATAKATASTTGAPPAGGGGIAGPATVAGAKAVVADLQKDVANLDKVIPSPDELKAIFSDAAAADAVAKHVQAMMSQKPEIAKGDPQVFCASSEDVKAWKPEVEREFPGGYKRVGPKLGPGLTVCKFKIGGTSYDALINVKGKWYFVPKSFRALKE